MVKNLRIVGVLLTAVSFEALARGSWDIVYERL